MDSEARAAGSAQDLVRHVPVGLYRTAPDGAILEANEAAAHILGFPSGAELVRANAGELHQDPAERGRYLAELASAPGQVLEREVALRRRDGRPIWVRDRARGILGADGRLSHIDGLLEDVTEARRVREALRESEERYRLLVEGMSDVVYRFAPDGRMLSVNGAVARLLGYMPEEVAGRSVFDIVAPESLAAARRHMEDKLAGRADHALYEIDILRKDGARVPVEVSSHAEREGGRLVAVHGLLRSVQERRQALAAAEASRRDLEELLENANDIIYTHDLSGRFRSVNAMSVRTYGYSRGEFLSMSIGQIVDPAHLETAKRHLAAKATGGEEHTPPYELLTRAKDGRAVWVEVSSRVILEGGRPAGVQGIARDITARKEAEERFRSLFDSVPVGLFRTTPEGRILEANAAMVRILGYPDKAALLSRRAQELYADPAQREAYLRQSIEVHKAGGVQVFEAAFRRADGSIGHWRASSKPVPGPDGAVRFYEGHVEDVTAQHEAEAGMRVAQRLAAEMEAAPDFPAALAAAMRGLGELTGWSYGEAWMRQGPGRVAVIDDWWGERTPALQKFRHITKGIGLEPGQGLAGNAWSRGETLWKDPLDRHVVRAAPAAAAGLTSAVAVPVGDPGRPVAVLAFFNAGSLEQGRWGPMLEAVAGHLRRVTARRDEEDRLRSRLALLEAQLEAAPEAVLVVSEEGDVLAANRRLLRMCGEDVPDGPGSGMGVLAAAADPARLMERLRRLYEGRGPIVDTQGRTFERREPVPLTDARGRRTGRILWFRESSKERRPAQYHVA